MIPDKSIIEKGEEMIAIAKEFGASNVRFFGEVTGGNPRPNCGVDILVDVERGRLSKADIYSMESKFSELLGGRLVGLKIPDMFIPPILKLVLEEVVHLDVLLNQNTDHLKEADIESFIIEKRLELLAMAKRYGATNVRLAGDIIKEWRQPDCTVGMLVDIDRSIHFDRRDLLHLEIRMGKILGRSVNICVPDMMIPPLRRDYLEEAVTL